MALCNFCKKLKVRSTDFIFMIIMCVLLYFVYKWQFATIQEERELKNKQQEQFKTKQLNQIKQFLESACQRGDKEACEQLQRSTNP